MFTIDEEGYADVSDENIDELIEIYLTSEIGSSCQSAKRAIVRINSVLNLTGTYRGSGNALFISVGPETTNLRLMVGSRREIEIKTLDLLNYVVLWHDFLFSVKAE